MHAQFYSEIGLQQVMSGKTEVLVAIRQLVAAAKVEGLGSWSGSGELEEVRRELSSDLERLLSGARHGHLVALLLQRILDAARDGVFVFDDEDGC